MTAIVITHSDIQTYLTCRRAWYWGYVSDFKKPEKLVGNLALGTRVHAAIEHYYRTGDDPVPVHDAIAKVDLETMEMNDAPGWDIEQMYKDMIVGRNCVVAHQEWLADTGADDPYEVEAVEQTVEAPILGGRVLLRGKVDKLFRRKDDGGLVIDDTKTDASWSGNLRERLERSYQHWAYLIALRLADPETHVSGAQYTVIKKVARLSRATTPVVKRFRVPGTTRMADTKLKQVETICEEMLRTMALIESDGTRHAYPTPSAACNWCDFKHPCEIMDESTEAARAMLDREYIRGGRHGRYV